MKRQNRIHSNCPSLPRRKLSRSKPLATRHVSRQKPYYIKNNRHYFVRYWIILQIHDWFWLQASLTRVGYFIPWPSRFKSIYLNIIHLDIIHSLVDSTEHHSFSSRFIWASFILKSIHLNIIHSQVDSPEHPAAVVQTMITRSLCTSKNNHFQLNSSKDNHRGFDDQKVNLNWNWIWTTCRHLFRLSIPAWSFAPAIVCRSVIKKARVVLFLRQRLSNDLLTLHLLCGALAWPNTGLINTFSNYRDFQLGLSRDSKASAMRTRLKKTLFVLNAS